MNRRGMNAGAVAMAATAATPLAAASAVAAPEVMLTEVVSGVEWLRRVKGLTYDLRKQYVANLRVYAAENCAEPSAAILRLIDLIEEMNERGAFDG